MLQPDMMNNEQNNRISQSNFVLTDTSYVTNTSKVCYDNK